MCRYPGDCQPGLTRVATARNCTSVARPQEAAQNLAQIVRRAPDWWRLPRSPLPPLRSGAALRSPTCSGPRPSTTSPGRKRNKWVPGCTPACSRSAGSLFLTRLIFRNSWFISFGSHGVASAHPSRERRILPLLVSLPKHEGTVGALAPAAELNETAVVDQAVASRGSGGCAPRGTARGTTDPARHP